MKTSLFPVLIILAAVWFTPARAERLVPPSLERPFQHAYRWIYFGPSGIGYAADREVLISTVDGGNTWVEVINTERDQRSYIYRLSFFDDTTFLLYGWGGFYRSTDRGLTFKSLAATGPDLAQPTRWIGTGYAAFVDVQHGWAVAGRQQLRTTDGGQSWNARYLFLPKGKEVSTVIMFDLQRGLALGNTVLLRTTDGGTTWRASAEQLPRRNLEIRCVPAGFCIALDRPATTAHFTTDYGETWKATQTGIASEREPIADIQVIGVNDAVIVGHRQLREYVVHEGRGPGVPTVTTRPSGPIVPDHAYLQRWDGTQWSRTEYPEIETLWAIHYVSATDVWASADTNGILHSTDGAQTWTFVPDYYRQIAALTPTMPPLVFPTPTP
jgi:photosystem II stability/assembly factor-like uncharacterized protein